MSTLSRLMPPYLLWSKISVNYATKPCSPRPPANTRSILLTKFICSRKMPLMRSSRFSKNHQSILFLFSLPQIQKKFPPPFFRAYRFSILSWPTNPSCNHSLKVFAKKKESTSKKTLFHYSSNRAAGHFVILYRFSIN